MEERMVRILHLAKDISGARTKMNVVIRNIEDEEQQSKLVGEVRFIDRCIDELLKEVINGLANCTNSDSPRDDGWAVS